MDFEKGALLYSGKCVNEMNNLQRHDWISIFHFLFCFSMGNLEYF